MATNRHHLALAATAVLLLVLCSSSSVISFKEANPIRTVTDQVGSDDFFVLHALGSDPHYLDFARFVYRYSKKYESAAEVRRRFAIFVENLELIDSTNRRGLPYTLGINGFADWTWEEFRASRLGAVQNCSATSHGKARLISKGATIPEMKDWREERIVSPVKDQGHCGSCWTFSTTGALEAAYAQTTRKNISLSEQQLVDCATAFNNFGCNGGLPSQAFEYIKYNGGIVTEESYPYLATNGICSFKPEDVAVQVVDSINITKGDEHELKVAVGLIRPVSVAFQVVEDFRFYKSGIYTSDTCGNTEMDVNHAVLVVGYGVDDGIPYWIIKNSWSDKWGMSGYFRMELGKNMCGVATCASYPVISKTDTAVYRNHRKERMEMLNELLVKGIDLKPLPVINQDTLILWGDKDNIFPLQFAHQLHRHLTKKSTLEVIEDAGHALQLEKYEQVNYLIEKFLVGVHDDKLT